ncbi:MAG: NTP transferase domain-containing protein [Tepidisphaera sp.]|nr:NTP transferase domain-containing protein [Tepidisphaera sp.]
MAVSAIILAAGKGTRMRSDLPKVVFPVGGRPMVCAVVDACLASGVQRIVVIVGHKQELVRDALKDYDVEYVTQDQQLGTGHAVMCAAQPFEPAKADQASPVLVLCGDGPLIREATIRQMLARHAETRAAATLATSIIDDPTGYGRIVRDGSGKFVAIVEHKNATDAQRQIREVNPSYYCFEVGSLFGALRRVTRNALTGEYYITDVPELLLAEGKRVEVIDAVPPEDVLSINTPEDLARVDAIYRGRTHNRGGPTKGDGAGTTGAHS